MTSTSPELANTPRRPFSQPITTKCIARWILHSHTGQNHVTHHRSHCPRDQMKTLYVQSGRWHQSIDLGLTFFIFGLQGNWILSAASTHSRQEGDRSEHRQEVSSVTTTFPLQGTSDRDFDLVFSTRRLWDTVYHLSPTKSLGGQRIFSFGPRCG